MILRAALLSAIVLAGGAYASYVTGPDTDVARTPLAGIPCTLDRWTCERDTPLDDAVLQVLGADDYVNRTYRDAARNAAGLYIGYYHSQRQGDSIHSPQNCLPGSGWQPVASDRATIDANGTRFSVNRYVVQKGLERQVVLYWYQGRGRVVANEYANKFWLMIDQARLHRSNGSLVRIVVPVVGTTEHALISATASADHFARVLYPRLSPHLP